MSLAFDISEQELPIFLSEADEHLQNLDSQLLLIERHDYDAETLQSAFRSAHTLKGMAGMIGHTRMVQMTHALETALDGFRKGTLSVSEGLIDLCLDAVDGLRHLRDEVVNRAESEIDIDALVSRFASLQVGDVPPPKSQEPTPPASPQKQTNGSKRPPGVEFLKDLTVLPPDPTTGGQVCVRARINPNSVASAARALQLMMALQDVGEILEMTPSLAQIETAQPVGEFTATVQTDRAVDDVRRALEAISDVDELVVEPKPSPQPAAAPQAAPENDNDDDKPPEKLGEFMIAQGLITPEQLEEALQKQKQMPGEHRLIGQVLVELGYIRQQDLDAAVASLLQKQRQALVKASSTARKSERKAEMTVRTSVERLDILMNLIGELITDRNHLNQIRNRLQMEQRGVDTVEKFSETVNHLGRITDQLQEEVMRIRMLPVSNVFHKFPRLVRDLAQQTGKKVDLIIEGEDTELDRSVIDMINDPLIHILRNAVDHGIEPPEERIAAGKPERGRILLTARHEHGHIVITVEDDGRGINAEKLRQSAVRRGLLTEEEVNALPDDKAIELIFHSGFSTASSVTDISGRGVGMDIVRANIQRINGNIQVETHPGIGTQFSIVLPLTLAIVPTLLVKVAESIFAIPLVMVAETLRLEQEEIRTIRGEPVTVLRDSVLPLIFMDEVYDLAADRRERKFLYVVVVQTGKQRVGLVVDALMGEEEVVVKALGALVGEIPGISSGAILGDGQIALIVDVPGLLFLAGIHKRRGGDG